MNFKHNIPFSSRDLIPLVNLTTWKALILLNNSLAKHIRHWRSRLIVREFEIREFTDRPKLIAEDFNQKIYSRQNITKVHFLSKTTANQLVDFYHEWYEEDIKIFYKRTIRRKKMMVEISTTT